MARRSKTKKLADLPAQTDPAAALSGAELLAAAQPVLKELRGDLLGRAKGSAALTRALKARHASEKKAQRTADGFVQWQNQFVGQVAAAWFLSCVFVRTLEDRGLLDQQRLAGAGAADAQRLFFQLAPSLTERDYLLTVFRELCRYPAARDLFDARHNPVWLLAPSAKAAKALLALFRTPTAEAPAFRFGQQDTRFLGDLYQDLDEGVRKRYALLQTPDFVEQFILDRTLEPAIAKFGLDDTDLIDPTCGSGHFLLGAFDRLYDHQLREKPGLDRRQAATLALDKVYGADINPYAVAIARFRLTLSFLAKGHYPKLSQAPKLPLHLAVADSLLYNPQHTQASLFHQEGIDATAWDDRAFELEDQQAAKDVLHRQYAAVVGNPPYITVKDAVLRDRYREMYVSAAGKYSLSAPFAERFFQLARAGGRVGQITANSFMKREFGKRLIQDYLPSVNLDLIVNTAGAYIPGHGTPTVLLFGSNNNPLGNDVRAVLAKRGEPATPTDAGRGVVWLSVAEHWHDDSFENDYISVTKLKRDLLAVHPWSLAGGGAGELKATLEQASNTQLGDLTVAIGFMAITGEDDVYVRPVDAWRRAGVEPSSIRPFGVGEDVRDWQIHSSSFVSFPYTQDTRLDAHAYRAMDRCLWPHRTLLGSTKYFGKTKAERGLDWREYAFTTKDRLDCSQIITFAFVATHNHFVLDRGGKVFKQSAPIIKLPESATEEDHLALLAYLNSSTACFWMKQVFYPKGGDQMGDGGRLSATTWQDRYEFAGTGLKALPLPPSIESLLPFGRQLTALASQRAALTAQAVIEFWENHPEAELATALRNAAREEQVVLDRMVEIQERLDWTCYGLFRLCDPSLHEAEVGADRAGARVVEYDLALHRESRKPDLAWFRRSGLHVPSPKEITPCQRRRLDALEESRELRLIEQLDFKRWWRVTDYQAESRQAIERALVAKIERELRTMEGVTPLRQLAARIADGDRAAGLLVAGREFAARDISELVEADCVPYLAALRFTPTGLEKHAAWQQTWDLQRREDLGEEVGNIPVPPKYTNADFRHANYYRLRGKLDVPKERFIAYPGCESDEDNEPVYGWAGWDHEQRAKALATLYWNRKTQEGWDKARLLPMLAGLDELMFWLELWHNQPQDDYAGDSPANYYQAFINTECQLHGFSIDELRSWRPPAKRGRGRSKKASAS